MSGGGVYSLATIGAKHVIDAATPMVLEAIESLPLGSFADGFTLSDMGTADAGTSMAMITRAIDCVSARDRRLRSAWSTRINPATTSMR